MAFNMENYNQQVASIQGQLAALQNQKPYAYPQQFYIPPTDPQQLKYVDGLDGAKEFQSKMYRE